MENDSISKDVYDFIIKKIQTNEWNPGDKIMSENALAIELNVSRVSVRKALDQLQGIGVIYKKKGSGAYISDLKVNEAFETMIPLLAINKIKFFELLEFRIGFESSNIELLENTLNKKNLIELEDIYNKMVENKDDKKQFYIYDFLFHQRIAQISANSFIISISNLIAEAQKKQLETLYDEIGPENGLHYHKLIIEALKNNDFKIATMYMKSHMIDARDSIKAIIEKSELKIV
jgi:GntR family transcriptional repressor for pyruvate dehydrogenase complex